MSLINTFEALSTTSVQQAYVDLVGKILDDTQRNTANGNVSYQWLTNAMVDTSLILKADSFRVSGVDKVDSTIYWANAWLTHKGSGFYDAGNVEAFNVMPGNVGANVFVTNSFKVLVPEKDFRSANSILGSNGLVTGSAFLSTFVNQTIANSNVYANLGINTGVDFALSNNYLTYYDFNANSFEIQNSLYLTESAIELAFAKNKTDVSVHILGGGGI